MSEKVMTIPAVVVERLVRGRVAADMLLVIGASALIAIAAQVSIPAVTIGPYTIPMTLQPMAVLFVGAALGSTRGAAAAALYLLEGISGLPVFAEGHGGAAWLLGGTAGYLYSYPFAAWLAGFVSERGWGTTTVRAITGMLLALGVIFLGGWSWLTILTDPRTAFVRGVVPFVVADIVKVAIGAALLPKAQKILSRV